MLGFSLTKLLLTAFIIAAVWYGFKWLGRLGKTARRELGKSRTAEGKGAGAVERAEEMEQCRVCGTYVAANGARTCERDDCPYPG